MHPIPDPVPFCSSMLNVVLTSEESKSCHATVICADVFHAAVDIPKYAALAFFASCDLFVELLRCFHSLLHPLPPRSNIVGVISNALGGTA